MGGREQGYVVRRRRITRLSNWQENSMHNKKAVDGRVLDVETNKAVFPFYVHTRQIYALWLPADPEEEEGGEPRQAAH